MPIQVLKLSEVTAFLYLMNQAFNKVINKIDLGDKIEKEHFDEINGFGNIPTDVITIKRAFWLYEHFLGEPKKNDLGRISYKGLNKISGFVEGDIKMTFGIFCSKNKEEIEIFESQFTYNQETVRVFFDTFQSKTETRNLLKDSVVLDITNHLFSYKYYYYDDYFENDCLNAGVSVGMMLIDTENESIRIKDKNHMGLKSSDNLIYKGGYKMALDGFWVVTELYLDSRKARQRNLHIILNKGHYGYETWPELMIGQYHNINGNLTPVSGTLICVLEQNHVVFHDFLPVFLKNTSSGYRDLQNSKLSLVAQFLSRKERNRIKTPKGVTSLTLLDKFMKGTKSTYLPSTENIRKVFLSTPTTCLNAKEYARNRSSVIEIIEVLENELGFECYCAMSKFMTHEDFLESNVLYEEVEEKLNSCDLFILILGNNEGLKVSSVYMELGYALQRRIFTTIFYHNSFDPRGKWPNLLNGARNHNNDALRAHDFDNIEEIAGRISKSGKGIFGSTYSIKG